jgi:hypothetical protein
MAKPPKDGDAKLRVFCQGAMIAGLHGKGEFLAFGVMPKALFLWQHGTYESLKRRGDGA